MNKEFMFELAERLDLLGSEGLPIDGMRHFSMHYFIRQTPCGTQGCIAGGACALAIEKGMYPGVDSLTTLATYYCLEEKAQELLDLTDEEGDALFYAKWGAGYNATAHGAAQILRDIAEDKASLVEKDGTWKWE